MSNTASPSPEQPADPGRVTDRRTAPLGVMPRHLQQWVVLGIAVVMVGIMALSGSPTKTRTSAASSPATSAVDANQQRIEEYQRRIQEQTQRLAAEAEQLHRTKDAVAPRTGAGPSSPAHGEPERPPRTTAVTTPPDRVAREEHARFADNVAFSRPTAATASPARPEMAGIPAFATTPTSAPGLASSTSSTPPVAAAPTPVPASNALPPVMAPATASHQPAVATHVTTPGPTDRRSSAAASEEPTYRLLEGTLIDTVLTNRLDGTFTGPVNCLVSVPVYASDQQHLVIPAGSRALGEARPVKTFGQSRLAVLFHRVILPNGTHVDLNGFHGLNQVGDLGLQDQVDRHYAQIFGVSLAIGAIAGFAQGQSTVGLDATAFDAYRQGVAANVSQSSARILDRFLNRLPTVTIREGHRIKVYLSNDLELPAYRVALPATGGRP
jgi:type IV secretory pathway VirB10-like protein